MNHAIPATWQYFWRFMWMPFDVHAHLCVRFNSFEYSRRFPIPNNDSSIRIARYHIAHVGRKVHATSVARHQMTAKHFFILPSKVGIGLHDFYLIVHGLERQVASIVRQSHGWHRVHWWICQIFEVNRNIPFKCFKLNQLNTHKIK